MEHTKVCHSELFHVINHRADLTTQMLKTNSDSTVLFTGNQTQSDDSLAV